MNRLSTDSVNRLASESHERRERTNERTDGEVSSVADKLSLPVTRAKAAKRFNSAGGQS